MPRIHIVTYPVALHDLSRTAKFHQQRDLLAAVELEHAFCRLGYRHGEQIFNQPPRRGPRKPPPGQFFPLDVAFVAPEDLLLLTTRLPMNDLHAGPRRKVARAYTDLENRLFLAFKRYVDYCARTHVVLSEFAQGLLFPGFESRREMTFRQRGYGAPYDELNDMAGRGMRKVREKRRRSVVFLVQIEHAWVGGPGCVLSFGVDGCTTSLWNYRLARDFRHFLGKPGFVMAEVELGRLPEHCTDMRWCLEWKVEPILVHESKREAPALVIAHA
jgi:hypothetical protein